MKPIVMDGAVKFKSYADAARFVQCSWGIHNPEPHAIQNMTPAICRCVHGKQKSAYGHTWELAKAVEQ